MQYLAVQPHGVQVQNVVVKRVHLRSLLYCKDQSAVLESFKTRDFGHVVITARDAAK